MTFPELQIGFLEQKLKLKQHKKKNECIFNFMFEDEIKLPIFPLVGETVVCVKDQNSFKQKTHTNPNYYPNHNHLWELTVC